MRANPLVGGCVNEMAQYQERLAITIDVITRQMR